MAIKRKNTSHYDGPYYLPQWEIYRDGVLIGTATKIGTYQDNYPWDWEVIDPAGARSSGHTGLLSEAIQEMLDYSK